MCPSLSYRVINDSIIYVLEQESKIQNLKSKICWVLYKRKEAAGVATSYESKSTNYY